MAGRRAPAVASLCAAVALVTACGGQPPAKSPPDPVVARATTGGAAEPAPPPLRDPVRLLPGGAAAVAVLNLERLRHSPHVRRLVDWAARAWEGRGDDSLRRWVRSTDRVALAFYEAESVDADGDPELDAVVVSRGRYRPGQLEAAAEATDAERVDRDGRTVFEDDEFHLAELDGRTWILGDEAPFERAMAIHRGTRPSVKDPRWGPMADRMALGEASLAVVADFPGFLADLLVEMGLVPADGTDELGAIGARLELARDADLELVVDAGRPDWAVAIADQLRDMVDRMRGAGLSQMLGLGEVLAGLDVRADGSTLVVLLRVGESTVVELVESFTEKLDGVFEQGAGGSKSRSLPKLQPPPLPPKKP